MHHAEGKKFKFQMDSKTHAYLEDVSRRLDRTKSWVLRYALDVASPKLEALVGKHLAAESQLIPPPAKQGADCPWGDSEVTSEAEWVVCPECDGLKTRCPNCSGMGQVLVVRESP